MKIKKEKVFIMRISEFDRNRLKMLADKYASGDMTAWALHGIINAPRKFIKKKPKQERT